MSGNDELGGIKNGGWSLQSPALISPVPQICVVASNVVSDSNVTYKITKGQWT
jgi:hypothetical protein